MTETPQQTSGERFDPRASDDALEVSEVAGEPHDHDGVLEMRDLYDDRVDNAAWDEGKTTEERPSYLMRHGLTAEEELRRETIDERLRQEEPDVATGSGGAAGAGSGELAADEDTDGELLDDQVGYARSGRLVQPDAGAGADTESNAVATDVGIDGGAATAEEAAMHVVPEEGDDAL